MFVCTIVIAFPVQAYKNNDLEVGQGTGGWPYSGGQCVVAQAISSTLWAIYVALKGLNRKYT